MPEPHGGGPVVVRPSQDNSAVVVGTRANCVDSRGEDLLENWRHDNLAYAFLTHVWPLVQCTSAPNWGTHLLVLHVLRPPLSVHQIYLRGHSVR
jgi:hypothetical protein